MKSKIIKRKILIVTCPHCKKEIRGSTEEQNKYNLDVHIRQKHKKKKTGESK